MFTQTLTLLIRLITAVGLMLSSLSAQATWQLVNESSQLNFISTKASHIAETHTFGLLSGSIADTGEAQLNVDLASVATGIDIRNERMRTMLFNVLTFPQAEITTDLDLGEFTSLTGPVVKTISAKLSLVGQSTQVHGDVLVVPVNDNTVNVTTVAPIVVNANGLEMVAGIEALREVAGLPSISYSVPVTFSLTFRR
ncbi:MAG: YceI family protein [Pseudomonadota bacterium]|nr:YceI family protein [Pseudomonadota bacterium]MEC8346954.1 YceI family protein [Pseudomonadota bacterium]